MKPPMHAAAARSRRCGSVSASKRPPIARNGASWVSGADLNKPPHDMMWRPRFLVMAEKTEEVHHDLNTGSRSVSPGGIYTTGRAGSRLGFWKVSDLEPEW